MQVQGKEMERVLVVEDDLITTILIDKLVGNLCDLEVVATAEKAIYMAEHNNYKLILMDINLGIGKDGLYAVREIRNIERYKNIPIIAMTAYAMSGDKENFISKGCSDYISKPFFNDDFVTKVKFYLDIQEI